MSNSPTRFSTGIPELDTALGGGLLPGTMTVVYGATGIGKTQLGVQYAWAGKSQEGETGIFFDMTSRGDSQSHCDYAERLFNWNLRERPPIVDDYEPNDIWDRNKSRWDALHLFQQTGKRVTLSDLDFDQQRQWKADLNRKLHETISYFYGNFVHGARRCVVDGVEPAERASDSFQFELFEYVYHQILKKECDWVARDLFRVAFRSQIEQVEQHNYPHTGLNCLMLATSHEIMLEDLISRPIESGDIFANANTIILMGKVREGTKMTRALHVAKHRGSACDDSIIPFEIQADGLHLLS
ncbi:MAG: recombinase RecA [Planctomycetaceae bacterium]|nr:recombinase RecA [Planctomycetaceae bacterium]